MWYYVGATRCVDFCCVGLRWFLNAHLLDEKQQREIGLRAPM